MISPNAEWRNVAATGRDATDRGDAGTAAAGAGTAAAGAGTAGAGAGTAGAGAGTAGAGAGTAGAGAGTAGTAGAGAGTVAICADNHVGVTDALIRSLQRRGFQLRRYGALAEGSPGHVTRPDAFRAAAAEVAAGRSVTAVLCSWTGAGAAIDGMTAAGVRAAYCTDAETARRTRGWLGANVLAISLRLTSETLLEEILDGWFEPVPGLGPQPAEVPLAIGMGHAVLDQVVNEGHSALAVVLQPVERYDAVRGALLVDTVLTYCAQGYNFARTAEVMRSHPNTIRYRLDKVRELTGLDHRVAEDLVVLTLCARLIGGRTWNTRARHSAARPADS